MSTYRNARRHALLASIVFLASPIAPLTAQPTEAIKIGFASPLTGAQAHYGKDNQNGAQMAIDELNARGMRIGNRPVKFELVVEDDQADPKVGTVVAQKLIDADIKALYRRELMDRFSQFAFPPREQREFRATNRPPQRRAERPPSPRLP